MKPTKLRPSTSRILAPFTAGDLIIENLQPVVQDLVLADRLGFQNQREIRRLIERNREEIEAFGTLCCRNTKSTGGRPGSEFVLNRQQAMLVAILSKTSIAAQVRRQMIDVFDAATAPIAAVEAVAIGKDSPIGIMHEMLGAMGVVLKDIAYLSEQLRVDRLRMFEWEDRLKIASSAAVEVAVPDIDSLGCFLADCTTADAGGRVQASQLYRQYIAWAHMAGVKKILTMKSLSLALKQRGLKNHKSSESYWHDVKITSVAGGRS